VSCFSCHFLSTASCLESFFSLTLRLPPFLVWAASSSSGRQCPGWFLLSPPHSSCVEGICLSTVAINFRLFFSSRLFPLKRFRSLPPLGSPPLDWLHFCSGFFPCLRPLAQDTFPSPHFSILGVVLIIYLPPSTFFFLAILNNPQSFAIFHFMSKGNIFPPDNSTAFPSFPHISLSHPTSF